MAAIYCKKHPLPHSKQHLRVCVCVVCILVGVYVLLWVGPTWIRCGSVAHYTHTHTHHPHTTHSWPHVGPHRLDLTPPLTTVPTDILLIIRLYSLDHHGLILISLVDHTYLDVALNFYETSIRSHDIRNFLFVSQSRPACEALLHQNILCVLYKEQEGEGHEEDTPFGSAEFIAKMNVRLRLLHYLIHYNLTVLLTDSDVIYLRDPRDDVIQACDDTSNSTNGDDVTAMQSCDVCGMQDSDTQVNAGFLLLRPTDGTRDVLKEAMQLVAKNPRMNDQQALNKALHAHTATVDLRTLNTTHFLHGDLYFRRGARHFADVAKPCINCVVIHNNWIISKAAKIYRFKENLMWMLDTEQYYSNAKGRYIAFNNPVYAGHYKQLELEKQALKNAFAIARILKRTAILPEFTCSNASLCDERCSLSDNYNVADFDAIYGSSYREHVFLAHSKVPLAIKQSVSPEYLLKPAASSLYNHRMLSPQPKIITLPQRRVSSSEVVSRLASADRYAVLRFHSLYDLDVYFEDDREAIQHACGFYYGLQEDVYMQKRYYVPS